MHVLLTNDDGPADPNWSPYIEYFVDAIRESTDWDLSITVPDVQRSWIGKAHIIGKNINAKYIYTKGVGNAPSESFDVPQPELASQHQEWVLLDGTPATCANIGVNHLHNGKGDIDLVISGPNFGRNTSAAYILSSGTVGAAMEAAISGKKSIALSYSYTAREHPPKDILKGCEVALKVIKHLIANWHPQVQVYSVNIPLGTLHDETPIKYVPILENKWSSVFEPIPVEENNGKTEFKWAPKYHLCDETAIAAGPGTDAWTIIHQGISITPLRAAFKPVEALYSTTLDLRNIPSNPKSFPTTLIETSDKYVSGLWEQVLQTRGLTTTSDRTKLDGTKTFEYRDYDDIDFEERAESQNLVYSYVYRKGLIRKNYLANTLAYYRAKHTDSILQTSLPASYNLEVDYAEFLDDSLDEAFELRQEIESGTKTWILKPAMSDRAHGIRIFKTIEGLQEIFDKFEEDMPDEDDDDENHEGVVISNLRHFVVQEYLENPLLVDGRKFHLRVYVLAVGALKVYVYREMLALFATDKYQAPEGDTVDLSGHLTNTCFQGENTDEKTVQVFSKLPIGEENRAKILKDIESTVGDVFDAALGDAINFQPLDNAFEFYGLDFLVDSNYDVQILEVNAYPDFQQTGNELSHVVAGLFDGAVDLAVLPFFGQETEIPALFGKVLDKQVHH